MKPWAVIAAAALVIFESLGIRQSLGIFVAPISSSMSWQRSVISWSLATNQLALGFFQPAAALIATQSKTGLVVVFCSFLYFLGLAVMALAWYFSTVPMVWAILSGLLFGAGMSGLQFSVMLGRVAILTPLQTSHDLQTRTTRFGIVSGIGQVGQFVFAPIGSLLITKYSWQTCLWAFAIQSIVFLLPTAYVLRNEPTKELDLMATATPLQPMAEILGEKPEPVLTLRETLKVAMHSRPYILVSLAFFTCGYFIGLYSAHIVALYVDNGLSPAEAGWILSAIGIGSCISTLSVGPVTKLMGPKGTKWALATCYYARAVLTTALILSPTINSTFWGGMVIGLFIGFFWLVTVPLTSSITSRISSKHLATLSALSFILHQIGAFAGVLLGGYVFDTLQSYAYVSWSAMALSLLAGILVSFV
jgi:MFS family permease